jgi:hypothetical protein
MAHKYAGGCDHVKTHSDRDPIDNHTCHCSVCKGVTGQATTHVVFFNYHDPVVPLSQEDIEFYRYHPLLLNAAFLGNLSEEDRDILGFGDKTNYRPAFERSSPAKTLHRTFSRIYDVSLRLSHFRTRILSRLQHSLKKVPHN